MRSGLGTFRRLSNEWPVYHEFSDVLTNSDLGDLKYDYFRVRRHPGAKRFPDRVH